MTDTPVTPDLKWTERVGGLYKQKGLTGAIKEGAGDIGKGAKFWSESSKGHRGLAFGRVAGVGAGLALAGDALFNSKTSDGQDRSGLARVGEFVLGGGVAVGSLIVGKGR